MKKSVELVGIGSATWEAPRKWLHIDGAHVHYMGATSVFADDREAKKEYGVIMRRAQANGWRPATCKSQ